MDFKETLRRYSRYVLIIFNFLFAMTGVVILSVGVTVKAYYHEYGTLLDDKYIYASDFLIIIGVIIFIIAFFGCCGALKENACMTLTFSTLLIVIFVLEVTVGIGGLILRNKTDELINKALTDTMTKYGNDSEVTKLWDEIQSKFNCCGVNNYTDWEKASSSTHGEIPVSCCHFHPGSVGNVSCNSQSHDLNQKGCLEEFGDYIESHASSIEGVGITLATVQLLGIVLSCYLSKQIRSDYETV